MYFIFHNVLHHRFTVFKHKYFLYSLIHTILSTLLKKSFLKLLSLYLFPSMYIELQGMARVVIRIEKPDKVYDKILFKKSKCYFYYEVSSSKLRKVLYR